MRHVYINWKNWGIKTKIWLIWMIGRIWRKVDKKVGGQFMLIFEEEWDIVMRMTDIKYNI
jgi:hypothetical protein